MVSQSARRSDASAQAMKHPLLGGHPRGTHGPGEGPLSSRALSSRAQRAGSSPEQAGGLLERAGVAARASGGRRRAKAGFVRVRQAAGQVLIQPAAGTAAAARRFRPSRRAGARPAR